MPSRDDPVPFSRKLGRGPGCFTQLELLAAILTMVPAGVEVRADGVVRGLVLAFGALATVVCFWVIVLFNWHVLRRLFFDASGNEILRSARANAGLTIFAMVALALCGVPCYVLGHLIAVAAQAIGESVWRR